MLCLIFHFYIERGIYESSLQEARAKLEAPEFEQAFAQGQLLPLEEAVNLCLDILVE